MIKAFVALLLLFGFAWADHDNDDHHIPRDLSYLDLSEQQYHEVRAILYDYRRNLKAYRHEKRANERAVRELFLQENFDAKSYEAKSLELEKKAMAIQSEFLKRLHDILSPWQRERFLYYFNEWDVD